VNVPVMLQVTTLVERIQQLCNVKLTSTVCDTFTSWADATHRVDARRRDEIANAINRHRTKNVSQKEKDKGFSLSCILFSVTVTVTVTVGHLLGSVMCWHHTLPVDTHCG